MTTSIRTPESIPALPGYEVLGVAGRGGMGEVFIARQCNLDRLVALKFLTIDPGDDREERIGRFRREAELMAKVSHPNVLSIHDFLVVEDSPCLVMEFIEGGDLRRRMYPGRPMEPGPIRAILRPVGEALSCLHRQGILHRDLKPENILMHAEDNPKVADFGIAVLRAGRGSLTRTGRGLGTPGYVAPEQQYGLKVDERADQYSLAAIAYELLTGERALGIVKPPSRYNKRLGTGVDDVMMRALHEDPDARYTTVQEFVGAIDGALAAVPQASRRSVAPWIAVAVPGTLALAAAGFLGWSRWGDILHGPPNQPPGIAQPPGNLRPPENGNPPPQPPGPVVNAKDPADPAQLKLIELRAYLTWIEQGQPTGEEGDRVAGENWKAAKVMMQDQVDKLAFQLWVAAGRPMGEAGRAAVDANIREAQRILKEDLDKKIGKATLQRQQNPEDGP